MDNGKDAIDRIRSATDGSAVHPFVSDYLCHWPEPTEEDRYLYSLAAEYHQRAEAYDRTVCTGPIKRGEILPATDREMVAINRHALSLKKELQERAYREHGISGVLVTKAIQKFNR